MRRMFETGTSIYSGSWAEGSRDVVLDDAGALYFSTSSRMILPSGPEPLTLDRGIPRSKAIFLAIGDANMRSPAGSSGLESLDSVGSDFGGTSSDLAGGFSSFGGSDEGAEAFLDANSSAAERSSPSSAMTAMSEPTWTFLAPSEALRKYYTAAFTEQ